ncbi:MAG: flagellar biosynthesis protein FlhA [Robiginitomaculum sp.]|nr:MAG: flagellar biosynthesis protein FlhA [Robiginitomaculum sp.]
MPKLTFASLYNPTAAMALALITIIIMMILPVPSWVLDVGLTASFAFAILIFMLTLFIEKPLDFSSFPAVLLASLLLRLSLNISSTKLIIGQGHTGTDAAGGIIEGFAKFIMGGNLFLGLIVFTVLVIVNFMVITKGAGRMAEVGARFALDAMPGKQLAIDSDLAAGAISHEEASLRRKTEQEETAFLGSLDGVSKFVKGDAIAGLLITLLNLIAGIAIGIGVHKVSFSDALTNYSILTVGDGLVSQIPAVIISIAAALLLAKGKEEGTVDKAIFKQFAAHPAALGSVTSVMVVFAFFPGLPFMPFMLGALGFGYATYRTTKTQNQAKLDAEKPVTSLSEEPEKETMGDVLNLDEIHLVLSKELVPIAMDAETGFDKRVEKIRKYIATEFGFILPAVRLTDNAQLPTETYKVYIQGTEVASSILKPGHVMALMEENDHPEIMGTQFREPVYQASARWVEKSHRDELVMHGLAIIEVEEVLATHLLEIIQANFTKLLTRRSLYETLDAFKNVTDLDRANSNKKILDEFIPDKVPMDTFQGVLRQLLSERVSMRNIPLILETIAEVKPVMNSIEQIAECVRQRISFQFIAKMRDDQGRLPLVQLGPDWENLFTKHEIKQEGGNVDIALPPDEFKRLADAVSEKLDSSAAQGNYAAIATSARRRRFIKTVMAAKGIRNPVISYEEIPPNERPVILAVA